MDGCASETGAWSPATRERSPQRPTRATQRSAIECFDPEALPPEHDEPGKRDDEGEEEEGRPAELRGKRAGGRADINAAERRQRREQGVLRGGEAAVAHRHEERDERRGAHAAAQGLRREIGRASCRAGGWAAGGAGPRETQQ